MDYLTFCLLICLQLQTKHIRDAKRESRVIHETAEKRPGGGRFYLPSMLTVGTFPYIASLITQKWSRKDRLA